MSLSFKHSEQGKCQLGLFVYYDGTTTCADTSNTVVSAEVTLSAQRPGAPRFDNLLSWFIAAQGTCWGFPDFFDKGPISSIDQLSAFMVDGKLKLRASINKLDGRSLAWLGF